MISREGMETALLLHAAVARPLNLVIGAALGVAGARRRRVAVVALRPPREPRRCSSRSRRSSCSCSSCSSSFTACTRCREQGILPYSAAHPRGDRSVGARQRFGHVLTYLLVHAAARRGSRLRAVALPAGSGRVDNHRRPRQSRPAQLGPLYKSAVRGEAADRSSISTWARRSQFSTASRGTASMTHRQRQRRRTVAGAGARRSRWPAACRSTSSYILTKGRHPFRALRSHLIAQRAQEDPHRILEGRSAL